VLPRLKRRRLLAAALRGLLASKQSRNATWIAVGLAALIRKKKIGCLELLDHFLARIEKYNPKLNAIIWIDRDRARKRARAADAPLRKGKRFGPLHGVPMSIKESYQVAGSPTTWGAPSMQDNVTREIAVSAQRMIDAGVTLFAKTNVPLMLADWQSYNAVYGVTRNPWDLDRTPGGSSGGSSAALSAGLTGIDAGSDIGSSIRGRRRHHDPPPLAPAQ
jgi:amidase